MHGLAACTQQFKHLRLDTADSVYERSFADEEEYRDEDCEDGCAGAAVLGEGEGSGSDDSAD